MLDPAFKTKWLNALRSGDYIQGRFSLCQNGDRFCCLGVAADLIVKEKGLRDVYDTEVYEGELGLEPEEIQTLVDMNDMEEKNFNQIADFIEVNL